MSYRSYLPLNLSPDTRPKNRGNVSIFSNSSLVEDDDTTFNDGPLVEEYDKELREQPNQVFNSAERQEVSKNKQCNQDFVPTFNNPVVYNKQTGKRVGVVNFIDSSSITHTGSLGASRSRPQHYRTSLETSSPQRFGTGGSVELDGQKESSGVSGVPYGLDDPPFKVERNGRSRDDGTDRPSFDEWEADSNVNEVIYRNSLSRLEAPKHPAEWGFGLEDSTRPQYNLKTKRRGNGGENIKKKDMSYGDERVIRSSQPSTKVVPQGYQKNATSGFDELMRDVSSAVLHPSRSKGVNSNGHDELNTRRLSTKHEYNTNFADLEVDVSSALLTPSRIM